MVAAAGGDRRLVNALLGEAPSGDRSALKDAALLYAAENGHTDVAKSLIWRGARFYPKIDHDKVVLPGSYLSLTVTALHLAVKNHHIEVVKTLLWNRRYFPFFHVWPREDFWMTALHTAVEVEDSRIVELLLRSGVNVNYPHQCRECGCRFSRWSKCSHCGEKQGKDALARAAECGSEQMVRLLISKGADPAGGDPKAGDKKQVGHTGDGKSLSQLAAAGAHNGTLQVLLELGLGDINTEDQHGLTPLWTAVRHEHLSTVEFLLQHGAKESWRLRTVGDLDMGSTDLLTLAAHLNHLEIATALLQHFKAILDETAVKSAIRCAARKGHRPMADLWLDHIVEIGFPRQYHTVLTAAAVDGDIKTAKQLFEHWSGTIAEKENVLRDAGFEAGNRAQQEIIRLLLEWDLTPEQRRRVLNQALLGAIAWGNAAQVRPLLEEGADMQALAIVPQNRFSHSGRHVKYRPLHAAAYFKQAECCQVLLSWARDNVDLKGMGGDALFCSAMMGEGGISPDPAVIKVLLTNGADVNAFLDGKKITALHIAARRDDVELVKVLLEHGADVEGRATSPDDTPLLYAGKRGNDAVFDLLLASGAKHGALGESELVAYAARHWDWD